MGRFKPPFGGAALWRRRGRSMYYAAEDIKYVSNAVASRRPERAIKISKGIATLTTRFRQ